MPVIRYCFIQYGKQRLYKFLSRIKKSSLDISHHKNNEPARIAMKFLSLILLVTFCVSVSASDYPDTFRIAKPAAWVTETQLSDIPDTNIEKLSDGVNYLLVDDQVNAVGDYSHYKRVTQLIINTNGIDESSNISVVYNPAYEKLVLHNITIIRNGEILEKTDSSTIEFLRRETDLEDQLYDGRLTAHAILDDIRVGDIIDYSYTVTGLNPALKGKASKYFDMEWGVPVITQNRRLLWPAKIPVYIKSFPDKVTPTVKHHGDYDEYIWLSHDVEPVISDGNVPGWFDEYNWINFSPFKNWNEIRKQAGDIYVIGDDYVDAVKNIVEAINKKSSTQQEKLLGAINFVQNEIRYTGIEMGINSYIPTSPSLVMQRRFGDCKDKVILFLSILKGLDIQAYPVLVNSSSDDDLNRYLPGLNLFDHVIAKVVLDDKNYWFDLTRSNQAQNIDTIYQPDYGNVLVLDGSEGGLVEMGTFGRIDRTLVVSETYDLSAGFDKPAKYTINSKYYQYKADSLRSKFSSNSVDVIEKDYFDYMNKIYPKLNKTEKFAYMDDRKNNIFTVIEHYEIKDFWTDDDESVDYDYLYVYQYEIYDALQTPETRKRNAPFDISHPVSIEQKTKIIMPESWNVTDKNTVIENNAFYFSKKQSGSANVINMDSVYKTKSGYVNADEIDSYIDDVNRIKDEVELYVYQGRGESGYFTVLENIYKKFNYLYLLLLISAPMLLCLMLIYLHNYKGSNPLLTIWFSPRETIKTVLLKDTHNYIYLFVVTAGILNILANASDKNLGEKASMQVIFLSAILAGPVLMYISIVVWSWLLSVTGKWLGGIAHTHELRVANFWGCVPSAVELLIYLVIIALAGKELFVADADIFGDNYFMASLVMGLFGAYLVATGWRIVLTVALIAEVQKFSILRALGNIFLSVAVFVVPFLVILIIILLASNS